MIMFIICITPRAKHTNYLTRLPDESMKRAAPSDEGGVTLRGERATAGVLGGGSTGPERGRLAAGPASPHSLQLRRQAGEGRQVRTAGGMSRVGEAPGAPCVPWAHGSGVTAPGDRTARRSGSGRAGRGRRARRLAASPPDAARSQKDQVQGMKRTP